MKIVNFIVFYDNIEEVRTYISNAMSVANGVLDIVLVVNKDSEGQIEILKDEWATNNINNCYVFDFKNNVGYLNSMLLSLSRIDISNYDYFILSNTDISYTDKSFFVKLSSYCFESDIGCIAPSVYSTRTKTYSNPHYMERIPKSKLIRVSKVFSHPTLGRLYLLASSIKSRNVRKNKRESCYVYSPHGCYMIFTQSFIKEINGYEYGVKMYSEESCIGELLMKHRMRCYYDQSFEVSHMTSTVTGKINYKKRFSLWKESIDYILKEFY